MKNRLLLVSLLFLCCTALPAFAMGAIPEPPSPDQLRQQISEELSRMDRDMAEAARQLSTTGLQTWQAAEILQKIYDDHPSAVVVSTIDPDGKLLLIRPEKYKGSEGENISDQPHFSVLKRTGEPVLSAMFKSVEGFYAVSLAYPVFSPQGDLIGFVSLVLQPDALARKVIEPQLSTFPDVETLLIQKDGRILYDRDIRQVGRMTFSDPLYRDYPELLALARRMTEEESGAGIYFFPGRGGKEAVKKESNWTTIRLHGTEWRLIISRAAKD